MEWVETTARTVDEAKELALDQLGVAEDDAELIIVDEPKSGLFGRMRGEARVRARVRPTQARQKVERRARGKKTDRPAGDAVAVATDADGLDAGAGSDVDTEVAVVATAAPRRQPSASKSGPSNGSRGNGRRPAPAERTNSDDDDKESPVSAAAVGEQARIFVDDLVLAFGLSGETTLIEDGDDLEVQVAGDDLGLLVGPRGTTLQAIQDLARVASQRRLGDHSTHLRVDIGGYRVRRREALGRFATQVADEVERTGTARALEPMSSVDRKIVHEALSGIDAVSTRSEGEDPNRRIIIEPAADAVD